MVETCYRYIVKVKMKEKKIFTIEFFTFEEALKFANSRWEYCVIKEVKK